MGNEASTDVERLLAQAIEHHQQGELTKAEWGYVEVLEHDPSHADALHLLGVIAHQMGNTTMAIERVERSLSNRPNQPIALNNLGNMLAESDRREEAIERYQRAIALRPDYAQAHHNLGNVLVDTGRAEEALKSYLRALALQPNDITSRLAVGAVQEKLGQFTEAVDSYRTALEVQSDSVVARNRLGAALRKLDRLDEAQVVYDQWLQDDPDNPVARHFRAVCEQDNPPDRASPEYVKATFDDFAEEFETCLADLEYRVPARFGTLLHKHLAEPCGDLNVADLGCGTGLCATHLREYAKQLVGVDLSSGMLEKAAERSLYDELIESDLTEFLLSCSTKFDLLVAADTFIYVGDLRSTFRAAAAALREGGSLLFSVEKLGQDGREAGFQINRFGRYMHSEAFVRRWLEEAAFEIREVVETKLRSEGGEATIGYLVIANRR